MRHQLQDVRERGVPLAVLWASEGVIYQRFGYGLAAMDGHFEVETLRTAYTRPAAPEGRVRLVDEKESAAIIPQIYDAMRRVTPGAVRATMPGGVTVHWRTRHTAAVDRAPSTGPSSRSRVLRRAMPSTASRTTGTTAGRGTGLEVKEAVTLTPRAAP